MAGTTTDLSGPKTASRSARTAAGSAVASGSERASMSGMGGSTRPSLREHQSSQLSRLGPAFCEMHRPAAATTPELHKKNCPVFSAGGVALTPYFLWEILSGLPELSHYQSRATRPSASSRAASSLPPHGARR